LDVAIHVHLVVEHLVVLDDETLKSSVLVAVQLLHQVLRGRDNCFFILEDQRSHALKGDWEVFNWQVVLKDDAAHFFVMLQLIICPRSNRN